MPALFELMPQADSLTLKRALTAPNFPFPGKKLQQSFPTINRPSTAPSARRYSRHCKSPTFARRRKSSMVQTSARTFTPMPSFNTVVYGDKPSTTSHENAQSTHGSSVKSPASSGNTNQAASFSTFHMHHDSRESNSTVSSDNSPTTTISTMDSSSVTDPSPAVSPESPIAKNTPSTSFVADFRPRRPDTANPESTPNNFFELQRPNTPARKPRNLKNLGINTASSLSNLRASTPASINVVPKDRVCSAPPSPLFIKPPTPPKRRPSNLSLTISPPGSTENKPVRLIIPSTPSFNRPALRHFQSSPSLAIYSPVLNPLGGMQVPPLRPLVAQPGLSEVPFEMEEEAEDQEPNFDVPQSREEKPAAYPNGPICIYEEGVYLYFEPTAEQATTFDCVINVASEVSNPFNSTSSESHRSIDARRVDGPPAENVDFASLAQSRPAFLSRSDDLQTGPISKPVMSVVAAHDTIMNGQKYRTPEYIHLPWEHNTDIVPDLYKLVRIIDERVQQKKRVLIHCQCGVSRSASLVVAYGLFKNPSVSVQEAYDVAKKRSRWIGPNMNLIMQLQEFRNGLLRQKENRGFLNSSFGRRSAGLPSARKAGQGRFSDFGQGTDSGSPTPQTAPLPPDSDMGMQRASTGNMMAIPPGPLSAPTRSFSPDFRRSWDASQSFEFPPQSAVPALPSEELQVPEIPSVKVTAGSPMSAVTGANLGMAMPSPMVPNFSRQLPLRQAEDSDSLMPDPREAALGLPQHLGFGALKSPAVASFNIEPSSKSPMQAPFGANAWPQGYDNDTPTPTSDQFGLGLPRATSFNMNPASVTSPPSGLAEIGSPTSVSFSKHVPDLHSPRSEQFHMTPIQPREADTDLYGLTSPTRAEFSTAPFDRSGSRERAANNGRINFQAILPPSHSSFNGFASLDGASQTEALFESFTPLSAPPKPRGRSPGARPRARSKASVEFKKNGPSGMETLSETPEYSQTPASKGVSTRFSSPSLRDQRQLHKLQTEIQSRLPSIPMTQSAINEFDALTSPRAEEFTKNPFHFEVIDAGEDISPASSDETIKDGRSGHEWTPQKKTVDPRSPVQTGSTPIVRNIFDVL